MSRNYGEPQFLDLIPDGPSSITPATTPTLVEFLVQAPKAGVGDSFPIGMNYVLAADVTFDQAAAGGSAVNWEDYVAGCTFESFDVNNPLIGNTHPRDTFQAQLAKHVMEFVSGGYTYTDGARLQVAAADGDTLIVAYQVLPMAHECFDKPQHSGFWLGWLNATKVQAWMQVATSAATMVNGSTGAVIKAPVTVRGWIEYVVSDELIMPVVNQWHRYTAAAGGQSQHFITGIGTANGLLDVLDGSRIAGIYEMSSANAMGGATTADQYTSMTWRQLSQDQTVNVDAYFSAFRRVTGGHRGSVSVGAAGTAVQDDQGWPFRNNTTGATGRLNFPSARFIPVRSPGRNAQLTKQPKMFGDIQRGITTAGALPTTGNYVWLFNEFRELGVAKKQEMIAKTGRAGKLETIWANGGNPDNRSSMGSKTRTRGRQAVLPERVMFGA